MLEFLAGLAFWQILIILGIILVFISGLIIFILKKIPVKINKGGNIISFNEKEEIEKDELSMRKKDLIIIVRKVTDITTKQIQIRKVDTLNYQMTYVEDKIGDVKTFFEKKFIETLKNILGPERWFEIPTNQDLKKYNLVIKGALNKIINSFRFSCRENHFDEYDNQKFLYYAERTSKRFIKIISDSIKENYINPTIVSQEAILQTNEKEIYSKLRKIFILFFVNARKISINSAEKIAELDISLVDFIINYLGIEVTHEEREMFIQGVEIENESEIRKRMLDRY